jgi:hypothetical protein
MKRLRPRVFLALMLAASVVGCGKKAPPSGGPPDLVPPRLVASDPDSGAARVARSASPSLTFSEGMEPRSTADAIMLAPPVEIRRFRWSGRTVTLALAESLRANQTYALVVGLGARDRHGNPMEEGASVMFTTADSFPPGRMEGRIEARGFPAEAAFLWCYDAARGHTPDSTARDFDALGIVSADGRFHVPGLAVPASYRLWAFADLNRNRSFEPSTELLVPVDTLLTLTREAPSAESLLFRIVNPRAPAVVKGLVLDSLSEHEGSLLVLAVSDSDTTVTLLSIVNAQDGFEVHLNPGAWTLRAFRDADKNRVWDPVRESASEPLPVKAEPAGETVGVVFVLHKARGSP